MATVTRRLAALLGASGAGLTDSATSSQITTTSLKDDAVTSAKIGTDQVGADALSSSAIAGAADIPANSVGESELSIDLSAQSVPHIIPGVLHPAYDNKKLDGTALAASTTGPAGSTVTSSKYGTVQSDGKMYYYTSIKGSKPIKDPRIGAHFGSQRHKFKSVQLLEQETATHGKKVYSVDGREYIRASGDGDITLNYSADASNGQVTLPGGKNAYIEIVGYFIDVSIISYNNNNRDVRYTLDDASEDTTDYGSSNQGSPLSGRYVDSGALTNFGVGATLGIHTIKITSKEASENVYVHGIELIAQDTTSTANRSKIQIPAQNVVSFGKKFSISATAVHYDPLTTMSYGGSGTTLSALQSLIDKDTSLGLDNWKAGTSNYHRPWNGGRVVKWVDSDGTIKTSVTMMPPNAQNIGTTASSDGNNGDTVTGDQIVAGTNDDTINFNTSAIDHSLSEVAKTFYFREFGNGNINNGMSGTTQAGSFADASMLNSADDIAYVMDDGLTSLVGDDVNANSASQCLQAEANSDKFFITFIGTGITMDSTQDTVGIFNFAQNLPYGTHVLKVLRDSTHKVFLDGVEIKSGSLYSPMEITFHQPKKPPIPEDCVVLADYMLMADFVPQGAVGTDKLSKGTRILSTSRDIYFAGSAANLTLYPDYPEGFYTYSNTNGYLQKLPFFGSGVINRYEGNTGNGATLGFTNDGTNFSGGTFFGGASSNQLNQANGAGNGHFGGIHGLDVGVYTSKLALTSTNYFRSNGYEVVTPIHTSHHYQAFKTPYLHELIGGDRSMEQTNLVCTPDGKIWDEVTRDTSYISKDLCVQTTTDTAFGSDVAIVWDEWRGYQSYHPTRITFNKRWAIAYNKMICLEDGMYEIRAQSISEANAAGGTMAVYHNGSNIQQAHFGNGGSHETTANRISVHCQRGDTIQIRGILHANDHYNNFTIKKLQ